MAEVAGRGVTGQPTICEIRQQRAATRASMILFAGAVFQEVVAAIFPGGTLGIGAKYKRLRNHMADHARLVCETQASDAAAVATHTVPTAQQNAAKIRKAEKAVDAYKEIAASIINEKSDSDALRDGHTIGLNEKDYGTIITPLYNRLISDAPSAADIYKNERESLINVIRLQMLQGLAQRQAPTLLGTPEFAGQLEAAATVGMTKFADAVLEEAAAGKFPGRTLRTDGAYQTLRSVIIVSATSMCMLQVGAAARNISNGLDVITAEITGRSENPTVSRHIAPVDEVVAAFKTATASSMEKQGYSIGLNAGAFLSNAGPILRLREQAQPAATRTPDSAPPGTIRSSSPPVGQGQEGHRR